MNPKWIKMYLDIADRIAEESHAVRLKVGAVFVSPDGIMSTGIDGMPAGGSNVCEIEEYHERDWQDVPTLRTKPECSHAEENLFKKLMLQGVSTKGGRVFQTHEPCLPCAKIMTGISITHVHYRRSYAGSSNALGKDWLELNNIRCIKEE